MNVLPRSCRELAQGEQEEGIGLSQQQTELHIHLVSHQATKAWTKVAVCLLAGSPSGLLWAEPHTLTVCFTGTVSSFLSL